MKKRLLLVVCICIISMLAIVGCGSVSSASILLDMAKNTKEVKSVDMNIKMVNCHIFVRNVSASPILV